MDNLDIETNQINTKIIGITCSAATVNSLKDLINSLSEQTDYSFLIFQDLSRPQEQNLAKLLQETTAIPIQEIVNTADLKPNHIYVIPDGSMLTLDQSILKIKRQTREEKTSECLDRFFRILADKFGNNAIGIMLEWSATDGAFGLKKIREKGGVSIAAISQIGFSVNETTLGYFDYFVKPTQVSELLHQFQTAFRNLGQLTAEEQPSHNEIMELTGFKLDFSLQNYNSAILQQKIGKRIVVKRQPNLQKYLTVLKDNPSEKEQLFFEIHNTTAFLHGSTTDFDVLSEKVFPTFIDKKIGSDLRIWSAGCSTGEEVYLLAIILDEFLNKNRRSDLNVKIFATDFSIKNIERARSGIYSEQDLKYLDEKRISQYFIKKDNNWHVSRIIRDNCVIAVHDLTKDFPFSGMDFISCRNVLDLFNQELQQKIIASFHYALNLQGFLHLDKTYNLKPSSDFFEPTLEKRGLYSRNNIPSRYASRASVVSKQEGTKKESEQQPKEPLKDFRKITAEVLAEQYAPAAVLINERFEIVHFNGDTSPFLQPSADTPSLNILNMVHHEVRPILKNAILNASIEKTNQQYNVNITAGKSYIVSFEVAYLTMHSELLLVIFNKKSIPFIAEEAISITAQNNNLSTEYNSNQLNEKQQLYFEELQTSNEELLRRTEEIESINEQLETVAEELRSNNAELSCTNDELNDRRNELSILQNVHGSLLKNLKEPLLIMDQNFIIHSANPAFYHYLRIHGEKIEGFSILEAVNTQWISPEFKELVLQKINRREMVQDVVVNFKIGTTVKTCLVYASLIENEQYNRVMLTFKDITEMELLKKQLAVQNKKQQEYIKKLESFTVSATDKLLDPVRKIQMFGKKIAEGEKALTQGGKYSLERLLNTSLNLDSLIENLLQYSRIHFEQKKPTKTDLNQILRKVINELKTPIKESSAIIESDDLPQLLVIPCQMKILFKNLINNSLQFSNETSAPILKIGIHHVRDMSHEGGDPVFETEYIKLSFSDNGPGFPQNYESLVFDPFYKLHRDEKHYGAGLGLALVKQIVYNHRGLVKVESVIGEGTSIHIYLPAAVSFEEHCSPN